MAVNVLTGARARFTLSGVVVALASRWQAQDEIQYSPIQVLDNLEDLDHVPIGYTAALSASQVRLIDQTIVSLGFYPQTGIDAQQHLFNILTQPELVAQLEDNQSDKIIARLTGVKLATRNFAVDARGVVNQDLTFVARRMFDESETT